MAKWQEPWLFLWCVCLGCFWLGLLALHVPCLAASTVNDLSPCTALILMISEGHLYDIVCSCCSGRAICSLFVACLQSADAAGWVCA